MSHCVIDLPLLPPTMHSHNMAAATLVTLLSHYIAQVKPQP